MSVSKFRTTFIRNALAKNPKAGSRDIIKAWEASEGYDAEMLPRHIHQIRFNVKKKQTKKSGKVALKPIPASNGSVSFHDMPSSSSSPRAKFEGKKTHSPLKASLIQMESEVEDLIQKASELRQSKALKENLINCRRLIGASIIQGDQ